MYGMNGYGNGQYGFNDMQQQQQQPVYDYSQVCIVCVICLEKFARMRPVGRSILHLVCFAIYVHNVRTASCQA
jgi:hypothetical protein